MRALEVNSWLRKGSSIIYHKEMLAPLITQGCLVSLRQALSWRRQWPDSPPGNGQTVLVGGLDTCLQLLSESEGEELLRHQIKMFIHEIQDVWPNRGLVFGFMSPANAFVTTDSDEQLLYTRNPGSQMRLSAGLWNGTATLDMCELLVLDPQTRQKVRGGFHVPRIS